MSAYKNGVVDESGKGMIQNCKKYDLVVTTTGNIIDSGKHAQGHFAQDALSYWTF